jgi:hypothetical protein
MSDVSFLISENRKAFDLCGERSRQEDHFGEPPLQRTPATVATATRTGKLISTEANYPEVA